MKGITTSKITFERVEETKSEKNEKTSTPKHGYGVLNLRLSEETHKKVKELAFLNETSYTGLVRSIVEQAVRDYELKLLA